MSSVYLMIIFPVNTLKGACSQEERRGREENRKRKGKGASLLFLYNYSLFSICSLKNYVFCVYIFMAKANECPKGTC